MNFLVCIYEMASGGEEESEAVLSDMEGDELASIVMKNPS